MSVVSNLAFLLVFLAGGFGARRAGVLDDARRDWLTAVAFYVALPALVFSSTATVPLDVVFSPTLVVGFSVVLLSMAALAFLVHRRRKTPATRSVAVVQSYHANLGFLGLPVVAATFGGVTAAKASSPSPRRSRWRRSPRSPRTSRRFGPAS